MTLIIEFLPLMLFLGAFLYKDIYFALVVLMIAMPIGLIVKFVRTKKFDKMYFWSTILLLIGGGLTLYFRNPLFLYWKPTVFYWVVAIAFLGSQLRAVAGGNITTAFFIGGIQYVSVGEDDSFVFPAILAESVSQVLLGGPGRPRRPVSRGP